MIRPQPKTAAPWGPFTCVEAVKRVLGVRARFILTPWRLYKFLREQNLDFFDYFCKIKDNIVNAPETIQNIFNRFKQSTINE